MHGLDDGGWQTDWRFEIRQGERLLQQIERSYRWQLMEPATLRSLADEVGLRWLGIAADWAGATRFEASAHSYGYLRLACGAR